MWKNYFKIAIRNLLRNRLYTLINILGLTLGISMAMVIYTVLHNETNFDSFHSKVPRAYRVVQHNHTADGTQFWNTTAYPLAEALRHDFPQLMVTQTAEPLSGKISRDDRFNAISFEEEKLLFADQYFLTVFDFAEAYPEQTLWLAGNAQTAFDHPNAVVLTQAAAERYFAGKQQDEILGKTLQLNDHDNLIVTGLIKDLPPNTSLSFDILISYDLFKVQHQSQVNDWSGNHQGTTFVTLPEQTSQHDLQQALSSFKQQYLSPEDNKRIEYILQPLSEVHTNTRYGSSPGSYVVGQDILTGLGSLALFIALIACVNYINLSTAQSLKRTREVGVRKVLGATRKQLFFQYMTETFLITLLAAILSVCIGLWSIDLVNSKVSFTHYNFILDQDFLLFSLMTVLSITLIAGSYPALALSKQAPMQVFKQGKSSGKSSFSIRKLLIVFQFSFAQLLIAATIIVALQMQHFRNKDLGYNKEAVLTVNIPDSDSSKQEAFRQSLLQRPEIEHISFSSGPPTPYGRQYGTSFRLPHEPAEMGREAEIKMVDRDYLAVYKLQMIAGNWISDVNKTEAFNGFVVNEALVRMLGKDPADVIGKHLSINEGEAPIIGVVKDFHNNSLQYEISPCVFLYWGTGFLDEASILLTSHTAKGPDLQNSLNLLENSWKEIFPDEVFHFAFLDERLAQHYRVENFVYKAFLFASAVAIFLGCLGLYGLISFVAVQRSKEVSIRKVLGASVTGILQLLSYDFIKLISIAVLIATPLAWYLTRYWLQDFAYRISLEWWHFLGAGALTMFIAVCTVSYQALKAATANPVKNLRTE
jgi:putative ABC transport system permease protein